MRDGWLWMLSLRSLTTAGAAQADSLKVAGLRQFAAKHNVALADASLRWGRLLKPGLPFTTLLSNSINHPDDRGHDVNRSHWR
jgi:hypothetical protein